MPSKSGPQQHLMRGVAHDPAFASKVGIPQSVGRDYVAADKAHGIKFSQGGRVPGVECCDHKDKCLSTKEM